MNLATQLSEFSSSLIEYIDDYVATVHEADLWGIGDVDDETSRLVAKSNPLVTQWRTLGFWFTAGHIELCRIRGELTVPEVAGRTASSLHGALFVGQVRGHEADEGEGIKNFLLAPDVLSHLVILPDLEPLIPYLEMELVQAIRLSQNSAQEDVGFPSLVTRPRNPRSAATKAVFSILKRQPDISNEELQLRAEAICNRVISADQIRQYRKRFFDQDS